MSSRISPQTDKVQLLLVLDHTFSMKSNDAKMNGASLATSVVDDFSIGDYLGIYTVGDSVRAVCPIRKVHCNNRFDADVSRARAEATDWGENYAKTGHTSIHRGVERAFRSAQKFHKLSRIPIILVVITDSSKWALSNVLTSKGFLNHIASLPICRRNIVRIFICTATTPLTKEHGHPAECGAIFNKNDRFKVYLKDISNVAKCTRTKWIIRSQLHEIKVQQCNSVIRNINEISGIAHDASPRLKSELPKGLRPRGHRGCKSSASN